MLYIGTGKLGRKNASVFDLRSQVVPAGLKVNQGESPLLPEK